VKTYYLYMMTNRSRVVLYTGVTNSLERRLWRHGHSTKPTFTKRYNANRIVYYECYNAIRDAISREKEIKGWRREKKDALVEALNPNWEDLGAKMFWLRSPDYHPERSEGAPAG
jgi:putative endonuclease